MSRSDAGVCRGDVQVRRAEPADCPDLLRLVHALAEYEREPDALQGGVELLREALFGPRPAVFCHVAQVRTPDGWSIAGMALWYVTFSTWKMRHGLWLEDLFVVPEHRRRRVGRILLAQLAKVCVERGYARLEWSVLDWNEPAHRFYEQVGAGAQDEWTVWRLDGPALRQLGDCRPPTSSTGSAPTPEGADPLPVT